MFIHITSNCTCSKCSKAKEWQSKSPEEKAAINVERVRAHEKAQKKANAKAKALTDSLMKKTEPTPQLAAQFAGTTCVDKPKRMQAPDVLPVASSENVREASKYIYIYPCPRLLCLNVLVVVTNNLI
jgi:hypothetical protein